MPLLNKKKNNSNFLIPLIVSSVETIKKLIMKKIGLLLLGMVFMINGVCQEPDVEISNTQKQKSIEDTINVIKVVVGRDRVIVESDSEVVRIHVGNREIIIIDTLEGKVPKIEIEKTVEKEESWQEDNYNSFEARERRRRHFKGHWAGVEIGLNNYLTSDNKISLPAGIDYMTLHTGKSLNFNCNFTQLSIGLARHIGFVTGLGINWNNYVFDGNNNILKAENGIIEILEPGDLLKKSKFTTVYLDLPVLLEFQIPTDHQRLNISAGPVGEVKLLSHTKMVFENKDKVKSNDDLSLNMLRLGATARIGYENFTIYGTYYFTPLFKAGKSPGNVELFPFEIGLAFTVD